MWPAVQSAFTAEIVISLVLPRAHRKRVASGFMLSSGSSFSRRKFSEL